MIKVLALEQKNENSYFIQFRVVTQITRQLRKEFLRRSKSEIDSVGESSVRYGFENVVFPIRISRLHFNGSHFDIDGLKSLRNFKPSNIWIAPLAEATQI